MGLRGDAPANPPPQAKKKAVDATVAGGQAGNAIRSFAGVLLAKSGLTSSSGLATAAAIKAEAVRFWAASPALRGAHRTVALAPGWLRELLTVAK